MNKGKIIIARHVDIVEGDVNLVGFRGDINENKFNADIENRNNIDENNEIDPNEQGQSKDNIIDQGELKRSNRNRKQPDRYGDGNNANCIYINYASADSPQDYNEVMNNEYSKD